MTATPTDKKLSERFAEARDAKVFSGALLDEAQAALRLAESHPSAIREAVEGCAKIAEMFSINQTPIHPDVPWLAMGESQQRLVHATCQCVAAAIRARGEEKGK